MMKEPESFKYRISVARFSSVTAVLTGASPPFPFLQYTVMCPEPTPEPDAHLHLPLVLRTHMRTMTCFALSFHFSGVSAHSVGANVAYEVLGQHLTSTVYRESPLECC